MNRQRHRSPAPGRYSREALDRGDGVKGEPEGIRADATSPEPVHDLVPVIGLEEECERRRTLGQDCERRRHALTELLEQGAEVDAASSSSLGPCEPGDQE